MAKRRNLTEREIVERAKLDLTNVNLTRAGQGEAGAATGPTSGGEHGGGIGVPANFTVIEQEVIDFDGEYRVNVVIEFDGVAGAEEYDARLREDFDY